MLIGRRDAQVKLNGQRIELGEVESGLMRAAGSGSGSGILSAAAAVMVSTNSQNAGNSRQRKGKQIIAWCVLSSVTAAEVGSETSVDELETAQGNKKRPEIIVPALVHDILRWLTLRELPLHGSGQDRFLRSLPLPGQERWHEDR